MEQDLAICIPVLLKINKTGEMYGVDYTKARDRYYMD